MPDEDRVIAIGLLTSRDLETLGAGFSRFYPVDETPCFGELLRAIDEADRAMRIARSAPPTSPDRTPFPCRELRLLTAARARRAMPNSGCLL